MASVFKQLGQISMVVEDVMETAKIWNDEYGIGPWGFLHYYRRKYDINVSSRKKCSICYGHCIM